MRTTYAYARAECFSAWRSGELAGNLSAIRFNSSELFSIRSEHITIIECVRVLPATQGHQSEMQGQPDGDGKEDDYKQSLPGPWQVVGLNGKNHDHEIIGKPGVTNELQMPGKLFSQAADQRHHAEHDHQQRYDEIDRRQ